MRKLLLVLPAVVIVTVGLIQLAPVTREEQSLVATADIHHNPASRTIRARLVAVLGPEASGIVVGVHDGVAVLSGEVRERRLIRRAEEIAASAGGIVVVHNFLALAPGAPDAAEPVEPAWLATNAADVLLVDVMTPVGIEK